MGAFTKEIRTAISEFDHLEITSSYATLFFNSILSMMDLEKIKAIKEKYEYTDSFICIQPEGNFLKVSFLSKQKINKFLYY